MWKWTPQRKMDFQKLKEVSMRALNLHYFDVDKPAVLSVDNSKDGLGGHNSLERGTCFLCI